MEFLLQEKELNQSGSSGIRGGMSTDKIDFRPQPPTSKPFSEMEQKGDKGDEEEQVESGDLPKQMSTEESDLGGSGDAGSKDDLQTVVEKPSPQKEKESDFDR